jgi:hypothetical protein
VDGRRESKSCVTRKRILNGKHKGKVEEEEEKKHNVKNRSV